MPIKTILACLNSADTAEATVAAAVALARRDTAHVIGLHVRDVLTVYPAAAMHVPDVVMVEFDKSQRQIGGEIEAVFRRLTEPEDIVAEWRSLSAGSDARADVLIDCARAADLAVIARPGTPGGPAPSMVLEAALIRESGRPVLAVPTEAPVAPTGARLLLGWTATREATRAAHDAVALFGRPGLEVTLLSIARDTPDELSDSGGTAMADHLARHGAAVTVTHRDLAGRSVAEIIEAEAKAIGADMVSVGAFGHSLAYDVLFGAATRDLLRNASVPVLFSA